MLTCSILFISLRSLLHCWTPNALGFILWGPWIHLKATKTAKNADVRLKTVFKADTKLLWKTFKDLQIESFSVISFWTFGWRRAENRAVVFVFLWKPAWGKKKKTRSWEFISHVLYFYKKCCHVGDLLKLNGLLWESLIAHPGYWTDANIHKSFL